MKADLPLRIIVAADVPADPNSGAAGTVFATNAAFKDLGHSVDEIWASDLPHRIMHWNLHYLLELPRAYRNAVRERAAVAAPDVILVSQPHAWLAARDHQKRRRHGVFVNRSHGLESMADASLVKWQSRLSSPANRFPRSLLTPVIRAALHRHIHLVAKYADGMIVPSNEIRAHLVAEHGADAARVEVVYHGAPAVFLRKPRPPMTALRLKKLLHVGQFSFIKGPHLLAAAVELAMSNDSDLELTWVCNKADHAAAIELFRPEFRGRVTTMPWVDQPELIELYDTHGVFVAHSLYEGAAKACTEAMTRGMALVSSAVGALKDHHQDGEAARLVEVGDVEAMAKQIRLVSESIELATSIGANAVASVGHLSWEACAQGAIEFFGRLLREKGEQV